jgi:hypothetical protein
MIAKAIFTLTTSERAQLTAIALRTAIIWASIIALGWFLLWWLVPNEEEAYWGVLLGLGVCIFVFIRKRRAMLHRIETMWTETRERHELDNLDADQQPKSENPR